MDHREAAKLELAKRAAPDPRLKFKGVPDYAVKLAMKMPAEEFDKLGTPMLEGGRCNCTDGGRMRSMGWDNASCTRCSGSEY